jgi:hypothetical protein
LEVLYVKSKKKTSFVLKIKEKNTSADCLFEVPICLIEVPNCPGADLSWYRNVSHRCRSVLMPICPSAEVSRILVRVIWQNITQVWETYYPTEGRVICLSDLGNILAYYLDKTTLIALLYWVSNCPGNMPKYYPGNMPKYYSTKYHYINLHEV